MNRKHAHWLFLALIVTAQPVLSQQDTAGRLRIGFASTIESFLKEDQVSPPPQGGILFIGSSIFRQWSRLKEQMAPLPVFNRAFGGSKTWEVLHYMDKIVFPYHPRIIVYYCGSNDINAAEQPAEIARRFIRFSRRVEDSLPSTQIYFVSINRAPQKMKRWTTVDSTNAIVREYCLATKNRGYIDVNPVLFDRNNHPRLDLYKDDLLHFREPAYEELAAVIKPVIERAWKKITGDRR
jgi:GDSL-like Lipase/Acylhydrolase family